MNLTDFYFLCAFAVILVIYYLVPGKCQWGVILVSSIAYYLLSGHPVLILYPVMSVVICYASTRFITENEEPKKKKAALIITIILLLAVLITLKYLRFINVSELLIPLGLSYYTFTLIGYVTDVYNGITEPQGNMLKLLAFGMYFPALVSGPIMQYREISKTFYDRHEFDLKELTYGFQRMLWGFFKKLVIADRLNDVVSVMFADPNTFSGRNVFWAILLFTIQLYSDFSGLMDIVLGISQCLGITLPENFKLPFWAPTVSEYWRRWHVTLGAWFREYVFYPMLRTKAFAGLQTTLKNRLGKKSGKQLSTFAAMFVLWLTVGLWHGGKLTYVLGSGLLHWLFIVLEESFKDPFARLWNRMKVDPDSTWLKCVRVVRTFLLVNLGNAFFRSASVPAAFKMLKSGFRNLGSETIMPWLVRNLLEGMSERGIRAVSDSTILSLNYIDLGIMTFGILVMLVISIIKAKTGTDVRDRIARHNIAFRYALWMAFLFFVILTANYGPEYSSAEFIYQGF